MPPPSYADAGETPANVIWRHLRNYRHSPPGAAGRGDRRATFDAALEQAEQLLGAAADVGPATRPLLAFYGISQAGRAVAAAATGATNNQYPLVGHGITNGDVQGLRATGIADMEVIDHGNAGAFTKVASFLGAASLPQSTRIGDLWCLLPDLASCPLPGAGTKRPLILQSESPAIMRSGQSISAEVNGLPSSLAYRGNPGQGDPAPWDEERQRVADYLSDFPTLDGWSFRQQTVGAPIQMAFGAVAIQWPGENSGLAEREEIARRSVGYRNQPLVFPAVGGSRLPAHPFMLWWALLFALSKLARYEPKVWADRINVSSSPDAVAIELLLDQALMRIPELTYHAIGQVSS